MHIYSGKDEKIQEAEEKSPGPYTRGPQPPVHGPIQQKVSSARASGASEASSAAPHRSPLVTLPPEPHSPLLPPRLWEKLSSTKPVPGAKKAEDHCPIPPK